MGRARRSSGSLSALILYATVALVPLPFGSTAPIVIAFWCVLLGLGLVLCSVRALRGVQLWPLAAVAILIAAYGLVLQQQLTSQTLVPAAVPQVWTDAARLLHQPLQAAVSLVQNEPFYAIGAPLAFALSLCVSYLVCIDRHRAHRLLHVIVWSGVVYAIFGCIQFISDPSGLLWREKTAYLSSLTGTFINRNTAAVYFGTCAIVCLLLGLDGWRSRQPRFSSSSGADSVSGAGMGLMDSNLLWLVAPIAKLLVLTAAMFMTASRAGVVFSLAGLVIAFAAFRSRALNRKNVWLPLAVGTGVALAVLQLFAGHVGSRFDWSGLSDTARADTYQSTIEIIADHPWLGTGLGTFAWSFPAYRSDAAVWGTWNRAHNTILELASEVGVPLAVLVILAWMAMLAFLVHGIRVRHRDWIVPIAALCAGLVSLTHSMIDFSLQIPGLAIVTAALLGAGMAQSYSSQIRQERLP